MVKSVKYALIALAVLIVLLLAAPLFMNAENYKSVIAERIEDATGRAVHISDIKLSLFPWIGVSLYDLRIDNTEGFSLQPFVQVGHFDIQVALLPLLGGRTEVKRFTIDSSRIVFERDAQGRGNWQAPDRPAVVFTDEAGEIPAVEQQAEEPQVAWALLEELKVAGIHLREGEIVWKDDVASAEFRVHDVSVSVNEIDLNKPVYFSAGAKMGEDRVEFEGRAGPIGDVSQFDFSRLPMQIQLNAKDFALEPLAIYLPRVLVESKARLQLEAKLEQRPDGQRLSIGNIGVDAPANFNISWDAQQTEPDSVRIAKAIVRANEQELASGEGYVSRLTKQRPSYQFRLQGLELTRQSVQSWLPMLADLYDRHPAPWKSLKFGVLVSGNADAANLQDVQLVLDGEPVHLSGKVEFGTRPSLQLRLSSDSLHVDPWLPESGAEKRGMPSSQSAGEDGAAYASKEPDLRFLSDWRLGVQFHIGQLHLRGLEMKNMRGQLTGSGGVYSLDPLRFDLAGGKVEERASLRLKDYPISWTESVKITDVDVYPILSSLADIEVLHGTLDMETQLRGTGLVKPKVVEDLSGKGKMSLTNGSIKGFDIAGSLRKIRSFGLGDATGRQTDFSELSGSFVIRDGKVANDDLYMASPLLRMTGHGKVDLVAQSLDYHAKPRLVGSLIGQGDTASARKGLAIPVSIHGSLESPKLALDADPMSLLTQPQAIEETIKDVREGLKDIKKDPEGILKKGLKDVLPGLLGQ